MNKLLALSLLATLLAQGASAATRVKVTQSTPITKPFTQKVQTGQQCYQDTVEVATDCGTSDMNSIGLDTIIGGVAGVVLGNQIGHGTGRDVAKVIGGIGGALGANALRSDKSCKTYKTIDRCEPKYSYVTENRVVGYNNCANYKGQEYCIQTPNKLSYIKVEESVTITAD